MTKFKIGDKVKMSKAAAIWILEHPDAWETPRMGEPEDYDQYAIDAMLTLMGVPPIGTVGARGAEDGVFEITYSKAHEAFYEAHKDFYHASKVELDVKIDVRSLRRLNAISKLAGVDKSTALSVLLAMQILLDEEKGA